MKTKRPTHEYKLVPAKWYEELSQEAKDELAQDEVMEAISSLLSLVPDEKRFQYGLGAVDEYTDHFPGTNLVEDPGSWVMIIRKLPTPYIPPPLSIWFATPWPTKGRRGHTMHRVKIITPCGEIGVWPHEYSKVRDISKYYEFIGKGMEIKFFGGVEGIPADALFYIRSRGISKSDAITLLMGLIKSPEVCWVETTKETATDLGFEWPKKSQLATVKRTTKVTEEPNEDLQVPSRKSKRKSDRSS